MSNSNPLENLFSMAVDKVESLTKTLTTEVHKVLESTTTAAGETLERIASNPLLKSVDNTIGLDWLMTFLGKVDVDKVEATVNQLRSQYPQETSNQIAHRLIVQKTWQGGRLGLLTNIIPPIAALLLGVELIATTKLQTEMVYEIAAAYKLNLDEPSRRGEVLAIFGLSLGADVIKTGLTLVEIIPGFGAIVGASTNAAMLYVLGQTACRFYEGKVGTGNTSTEQKTDADWEVALHQAKTMDFILAKMIKISYPDQDWLQTLKILENISPTSVKNVAENLEHPEDISILLERLLPDFAPLTLTRCHQIALSKGEITPEEQAVLNQIAGKFNLDLSILMNNNTNT